jgi:hypothetical protein
MNTKWFQNRTPQSENRTLWIVFMILLCAASLHHQSAEAAQSSKEYNGFVVFFTKPEWEELSEKVAHLLAHELRKRGDNIDLVLPKTTKSKGDNVNLRPESSKGRLKQAWDAYYKFQFKKALRLLKGGSPPRDKDIEPAEKVLFALIRYVQGYRKEAGDILSRLRKDHPDLIIPEDVYPPRFVKLFNRVSELPQSPAQGKSLASVRRDILAFAKKRGWRGVWALRIIPVGWNGRLELQHFKIGRSPGRLTVVEVERGVDFRSITPKLLEKIFR